MFNAPREAVPRPTLGLRLEFDLQRQLDALARRTGRSKSAIAREAVRDYLARHDDDDEFRQQVARLNAAYGDDDAERMAARTADWLKLLDEEDGGYDWGPDGPPA